MWIDDPSVRMAFPDMQYLHEMLCEIYWSPGKVRSLLGRIPNLRLQTINFEQSVDSLWSDALERLRQLNARRPLVDIVLRENIDSCYSPFLERVLRGEVLAVHQRRDSSLIASSKEALLFRDDLTITGSALSSLIKTLQFIEGHLASVCRVTAWWDGGCVHGTGFVIEPCLVITAAHVVVANTQPANEIQLVFDDDGGVGQAPQSAFAKIEAYDLRHDWATLFCDPSQIGRRPLPIDGTRKVRASDAAYIIQHPEGGCKRVGYTRNTIVSVGDTHIRYLTDTQGGSSGSPVLDAGGFVIGLHLRAGTPQAILGGTPSRANEGLRSSLFETAEKRALLVEGSG